MSQTKPLPRPGSLGAWMLSIRPKTLSAGAMPVVVGASCAAAGSTYLYTTPEFEWSRVVAALVVGVGIQIGTNLVNDVADHFKGADTHERLGPPRVTNLGLLSPKVVVVGAVLSFGIAAMA
ncbi:MAG: 1,4-dihydroxy-2-naphthoate polyprenyltransferase, partial [Actinobacteria bacterium]|nr:1,4-dihydroxy-2-naphthoate polyprenyltransferase [Actinomycetota bacterium]